MELVHTTEVLMFEASDAYREDPDIASPAFKLVLKAEGVHGPVYYGKQIEEPGTWGCIMLKWDSFEAHDALMKSSSYPAILQGLQPALATNATVEMYHVKFSAPTIALEKPVTEVLVLKLKTPENREAVVDILSKISGASKKMLVFGQTLEDENKYILLGGWPTVEAHLEAAAKPEVAKAIEKLISLTDKLHFYHTRLAQYGS